MQNFLWGFGAGFGVCLFITVGWYHFNLKPWFDAQKKAAADKLMGK